MIAHRLVAILVAGVFLLGAPVSAQPASANVPPAERRCETVLTQRYPAVLKETLGATNFCELLAGQVYTLITAAPSDKMFTTGLLQVADAFSERDMQSRATQQAAAGGTPAQGQAIPSVQPTGVAAGTIAAIGTRAGSDALAALSLNPAVLFLTDTASRQLARGSRIADITVFIPVSGLTSPATSGRLRYVGARVRLNLLGRSTGDTVWATAERLLQAQASQSALFLTNLAGALRTVPNPAACVDAFQPSAPALAAGAAPPCGSVDTAWTLDEGTALRIRNALAQVRRAADAKYLGADLRFDFGDPTLGEVVNAAGTFMFAGVAAGKRFDDGTRGAKSGVRARLGIRHAQLDSDAAAQFAAEGGVGYELTRSMDDENQINLSVGVEFRRGGAPAGLESRYQTDFAMLRGSISVPLARGNSISINVGRPISGTISPTFSVNFDWGLLLSEGLGRR